MKYEFFVLQYFLIAGLILLFCPPAQAYVHLVYGSLITQILLSGVLGLLVTTRKSFFSLVKDTVKRISCFRKKSS